MENVIKIAIVWESATGGGVNSYLRYLLQSKAFLNKQITIFTNSENKGAKFLMKDLEKQKNIKFIFFKSFFVFDRTRSFFEKLIYYFLKPFLLIIAIFKFKKILSNSKFDVLLCECGNYGIFRSEQAAILGARKLKIPVKSIVVHHACVRPPLFMGFVFKIIDYLLTKTLTSLITVSKATKKTLLRNSNLLNNDKLESCVIHNGVPKNEFSRENYLNLKSNKANNSILKIGMVSRLSSDKGHEDLIMAFSKLPFRYKEKMIIIIAGEDEEGQKLKLKNLAFNLNLENKIEFLDYVDLDSKKIILSLDLLLSLTKSFEGFGLSIAEAMSVGTPILATDVGGVSEFFSDKYGKLIKSGEIEKNKRFSNRFLRQQERLGGESAISKNFYRKKF